MFKTTMTRRYSSEFQNIFMVFIQKNIALITIQSFWVDFAILVVEREKVTVVSEITVSLRLLQMSFWLFWTAVYDEIVW